MYWGNYGWGWGMGFGWIFMILFWILVIMGIIYLVKAIAGMEKKAPTEETPLDILKKRYARGDIAKEEYERIKDDILKQEEGIMKLVNAIVRTTSLDRIVKSLETVGIRHLTIFEIKGVGEQAQLFTPYSIHKMIQMIIPDESVNEITSVILDNAHTGLAGDGLIAVLPVEHLINIQTMERTG